MDDARPGLNIMDNNETLSDQNYFLLRTFDCQTAVFNGWNKMMKTAVWQSKARNKKHNSLKLFNKICFCSLPFCALNCVKNSHKLLHDVTLNKINLFILLALTAPPPKPPKLQKSSFECGTRNFENLPEK